MKKFKITLLAKNAKSPLTTYLTNQFHDIGWIDCSVCTFSEIKLVKGKRFFVTLLEDVSFQEILDVCNFFRTKKYKTTYVSFWNGDLILGPTHLPGESAGADSAILFLQQGKLERTPTSEELFATAMDSVGANDIQKRLPSLFLLFSTLIHELQRVFSDKPDEHLALIDNVTLFKVLQNDGSRPVSRYIYPLFETSNMNDGPTEYKILLSKYLHSRKQIENNFFFTKGPDESTNAYQNVVIIGGGTAGFLAALGLKKAHPELPVTVIESSKIPVIGVGEATTPEIRRFLFDILQLPAVDFYKKVKPTWKLGIKFFWGLPGDYYFNYPFGKSDIRSAYLINNDINCCSLTSLLMSSNSSFVVSTHDEHGLERFSSLSNEISYALHLDNESFIAYLKEKALEMGVNYIDDLIVAAEKKGDCNEINLVVGETGRKYSFDFYVDCSGFKSLLLEKILQSPYLSFSNSLFTDTAVTGCIKNSNKVKPYTLAESMNNGWCWNIPMRGEDHRGYVFSSQHCTVDKATEELKLKNPGIDNFKTVRFKSGRHREICVGNVFAIGNSYAFVEPLESTGIHMIIKEVEALTSNFNYLGQSASIRDAINKNMNDHWDYLKGFLSIHYKFNRKFDTPFWKDCRSTTDVSSIRWLLDLYNEVGLLSYTEPSFAKMITKEIKDDIFGLSGFDTLLLGQGVVPKNLKRGLQNKTVWNSNIKAWQSIQRLAVPLEKDLKILTENPQLI